MKPLIIGYSRWYFILQPLLFLAFASGPFALLHADKHLTHSDLSGAVLLLGGGAVLTGWGLLRIISRKPLMVLNEEGFFAKSLAVGIIPWSEIEQIFIHERGLWKNGVELRLRNPEFYLQRQSGPRRVFTLLESAFGKPPFGLQMKTTDTSAKTLVAYVAQRINQRPDLPNISVIQPATKSE